MSINSVTLLGRVGQDPSVREVGQVKVASFSLATGGKYTTKDGKEVDDTSWHNIVAWRSHAELVEKYIKKGSQVLIIGHLSYRKYTGNDGVERNSTDIIVDKIELCGGKSEGQSAAPAQPQPKVAYKTTPIVDDLPPDEDGLPF